STLSRIRSAPRSTPFPYTTLFRSQDQIKRAPEQTSTRILLADVQAVMGKPEDGKKTLADAVELFPKDPALSAKRVEFLERVGDRSEEHTSELQSPYELVCRLLLEK